MRLIYLFVLFVLVICRTCRYFLPMRSAFLHRRRCANHDESTLCCALQCRIVSCCDLKVGSLHLTDSCCAVRSYRLLPVAPPSPGRLLDCRSLSSFECRTTEWHPQNLVYYFQKWSGSNEPLIHLCLSLRMRSSLLPDLDCCSFQHRYYCRQLLILSKASLKYIS